MNESHPFATDESGKKLFQQWSKYYDLSCKYLIEKSPPNFIRTRYLQKIFSDSKFVVILRHPIAISYATRKFCDSPIQSLLKHLNSVYVLRYEDLVSEPQKTVNTICQFLDLSPVTIKHEIKKM